MDKNLLEQFRQEATRLPTFVRELLAGGVAGIFGKSSVAPLERVKILYQTGRMPGRGVADTLALLVKQEGILGLYRGNGAAVLRIIPYSALHFHAYEINRRHLLESSLFQRHGSRLFNSSTSRVDFVAGAGAGAVAVSVTYPLDLVRTRLACMTEVYQGKPSQPWAWKGRLTLWSVVNGVIAKEGIQGLYKGMSPTLLGILPYAGLKFYVYQSLKRNYHQRRSSEDESARKRLPIHLMLSFGGIAGLVGQTVTYPLDVVRRRMQVPQYSSGFLYGTNSSLIPKGDVYTSTWDGLAKISKRGGVAALFAGLSINYMKVIPSTAIGFTVYDAMKQFLDLTGHLS